jgi:hypothetical protein
MGKLKTMEDVRRARLVKRKQKKRSRAKRSSVWTVSGGLPSLGKKR